MPVTRGSEGNQQTTIVSRAVFTVDSDLVHEIVGEIEAFILFHGTLPVVLLLLGGNGVEP